MNGAATRLHGLSMLAGAGLGAFFASSLAPTPFVFLSPFPDLARLLAAIPDAAPAAAGAVLGLVLSFCLPADGLRAGWMRLAALANPAFALAHRLGPEGPLVAAAAVMLWRGVFLLAARRDARATVLASLAFAGAPLASGASLWLHPGVLALSPLLSPWGLAPRKAAGFIFALAAPLLMLAGAGAYLFWLFGPPGGPTATPIAATASLAELGPALFAGAALPAGALGLAASRSLRTAALLALAAAAGAAGLGAPAPLFAVFLAAMQIAWAGAHPRRAGLVTLVGFIGAGAYAYANLPALE